MRPSTSWTITVLVVLLLPALAAFPFSRKKANCKVQEICTKPYESRLADSDSELKICASLTLFQRCSDRHKQSCHSDIYYHTVKALIPVFMKDHKCSNVSLPHNETEILKIFKPTTGIIVENPKPTNKPKCEPTIRGNAYRNVNISKRYCGLFGDPHLRTFNDLKQTCVVEGAWPLIDNQYLVVQVTNVPLVEGFDATATNKITVLVNEDKDSCVEQKIYQAKSNSLPAAFVDGTSVTGTSDCQVKILEREQDSLIKIQLCHIGTDLLIRKVGQFLTFHIRMPRDLANSQQAQGLCITGCPQREIIDYRELLSFTEAQLKERLPKIRVTRKAATIECRNSKVKGFYLDSCVFDLLTTGDRNFTKAAKSALEDAFSLDSDGIVHDINKYNETIGNTTDDSSSLGGGIGIRTAKKSGTTKSNMFNYWWTTTVFCFLWTMLS